MGDKITAKETMKALGVPCVPGSDGAVPTLEDARRVGKALGYPVIVKATAGGGGRGMKLARHADEIETAFQTARAEAKAAFGNDEVYLEKYLGAPRATSRSRSSATARAAPCTSASATARCSAATRRCSRRRPRR